MTSRRICTISTLAFLIGFGSSAWAQQRTTPQFNPPSNGSSDRGGTTYYPVHGTSSGSSVGVIVTPNPGTPTTPPNSSYGVGVQIPMPGG